MREIKHSVWHKVCNSLLILILFSSRLFAQNSERLDFNSSAIEYAPSISSDGKTMIFQSNQSGIFKIYETRLDSLKIWGKPREIYEIYNAGETNVNYGGPSISYDGNFLFFCANLNNGYGNLDIYYCQREGNLWGKPKNIGKPINSEGYDGFPSISSDGNSLYFVRSTGASKEGQECFKIMVSKKDGRGNWLEPLDIPSPINMGCEKAPKIMADNKTMVFASIRDGGKGEFDLYRSQLTDNGWETPIAMDFANTPGSDLFASISASGDLLYYLYQGDIYKTIIPAKFRQQKNVSVQGSIKDYFKNEPLIADITIKNSITKEILQTVKSGNDGKYSAVLTKGLNYDLEVSYPGFSPFIKTYNLVNLDEYREEQLNINLFNKVSLFINLYDHDLYSPLDADITIIDSLNKPHLVSKTTSGKYNCKLPLGNKYKIVIKKQYFASVTYELNLDNNVLYPEFENDIDLKPKKKEIFLNINDATTKNGISVSMQIKNLDSGEEFTVDIGTVRDGKISLNLREGNRYKVDIAGQKDYAFSNTLISVDSTSANSNSVNNNFNIGLVKLEPGAQLLLKEIYFESNSFHLKEESLEEVKRVIGLLKIYPGLVIEIGAHTDDVGGDNLNLILSEKRANYVVDYMISQNTNPLQIKAKGYGEARPVVANTSEENKEKNRRLELTVISKK